MEEKKHMKKGTLTAIIGAAMILGLALLATPVYAEEGGGTVAYVGLPVEMEGDMSAICICPTTNEPDCTCMLHGSPLWYAGYRCDYSTVMDLLRQEPSYYGEDENYVYLKAACTDPITNTYGADPNGTTMIAYKLDFVEAWTTEGCPER